MSKGDTNSIPVRATEKPQQMLGFCATATTARPKSGPTGSQLKAAWASHIKVPDMLQPYKKATLYMGANGWYVVYSYRNADTNKMVRFKERFEMNRIKNLQERKAFAMEAVKFVNEQLAAGFNPFTDKRKNDAQGIIHAMEDIYQDMIRTATKTTQSTYRLMKTRFADFITESDMHGTTMEQITTITAERFQAWMRQKGLSPKSVNATIAHMGLYWDHAPEQLLQNPWRKLKMVRQKRGQTDDIFEPITRDEMHSIFDYLNVSYRPFARLALMIYYSWGRTVELCRLRISDVDLENNIIYFRKGKTKSGKAAMVQIVPPLRDVLLEMQLQKYPAHFYVFSNNWMPGPALKKTNEVSERWRELVKEKLDIQKAMYALKHTGNIDYLLQNKGRVDLKWQQAQNRHASAAMTERYCRQLGAYFVDTDQLNFTGF